ncbi:MAG: nitric-oxide reductase large subunit [Planctomycetota bacterium]|nr:MAG: nitric-oxide reductase large subunit [Planctomycetota bacterium]REJ92149.1 MAG: nitric-oxide reductase large subunit [Planctomycetota bacterium]REK28685.1 MAG: nitric-oxide reductase large subunit [Planctomycetota bacterium]REK39299.1 MAG: nitric-oxide reductase large subunit [Planctomycetota bacterium]
MRRLWILFALVLVVSFAVLGWVGTRIYQEMPPIPDKVVSTDGEIIIDSGAITAGQNVWQTMGGMEVGSVWGHGSYVAPDWTADYLHREAVFILERWATDEFNKPFDELDEEYQGQLTARLTKRFHTNNYDAETGTLTIDPLRAEAFAANVEHYRTVFIDGNPDYAIPSGAISDSERLRKLTAFFFWSSWAASADRPGDIASYTNNWPHEPLVGNRPTGDNIVWTGVSIIMLLAGISALAWWYASRKPEDETAGLPLDSDPLARWEATPSQRATIKYFWVVAALILVQMGLGVVTAHYGVEGDGFYGFPLSDWLPYSVSRTWHIQMGLFWIATAWLAAGLFIGPLVSDREPKGQQLGVNVLFGALLVVVVGSLAGQWLSVHNQMTDTVSFYFGHQGYEYVDLGRFWQILLMIGLLLWLVLMLRVLQPALRQTGHQKQLVALLAVSTGAIALFYGAGLTWGQHTHLTIVEYWRWWVVHLWVEGFFEVFATTVIAFVFMRLNLIRPNLAAAAALLSATIFLSGGIIGTLHHLYFAGTPTVALAWGSVFSALEVVPLTLVGFDAMGDLRRSRTSPWVQRYKWPIYFFIAVAFWNMVGAGLFGFMINPPIALYYMQGLNTTPVHGHAALFGVYGMLGIGLMLMCLRVLIPAREWKDGLLRFSFWGLNVGLFAMCCLSLLPVGLLQTKASVEHGYWYARSSEFMQTDLMQTLRWLRVPGDTIFFLGALALVVFVAGLKTGQSFKKSETAVQPE